MDINLVNQRNQKGETPIFEAVSKGNISLVKKLIANGADLSIKNNKGENAIFRLFDKSYCGENLNILKLLVENGASVDEKNNAGKTPVQLKVHFMDFMPQVKTNADREFYKYIINSSSNIFDHKKRYFTGKENNVWIEDIVENAAYDFYSEYSDSYKRSLAKIILDKAFSQDKNSLSEIMNKPCNRNEYTVLEGFIKEQTGVKSSANTKEILASMVKYGLDVDKPFSNGHTPLEVSIKNDARLISQFLLENNANHMETLKKFKEKNVDIEKVMSSVVSGDISFNEKNSVSEDINSFLNKEKFKIPFLCTKMNSKVTSMDIIKVSEGINFISNVVDALYKNYSPNTHIEESVKSAVKSAFVVREIFDNKLFASCFAMLYLKKYHNMNQKQVNMLVEAVFNPTKIGNLEKEHSNMIMDLDNLITGKSSYDNSTKGFTNLSFYKNNLLEDTNLSNIVTASRFAFLSIVNNNTTIESLKANPNCSELFRILENSKNSNTIIENVLETDTEVKKKMDINEKMENAVNNGYVLVRAIKNPGSMNDYSIHNETNLETEIRKLSRRANYPTLTKAKGTIDGNPNRSATLIGNGAKIFANSGYGINADIKTIKDVSTFDFGSGKGKKAKINQKYAYRNLSERIYKTITPLEKRVRELKEYLKKGGSGAFDPTCNEVIIDIKSTNDIEFAFFNSTGEAFIDEGNRSNQLAFRQLDAIYIRDEVKRKTGRDVPIFEYNSQMNFPVERNFKEDEVCKLLKTALNEKDDNIFSSKDAKWFLSFVPYIKKDSELTDVIVNKASNFTSLNDWGSPNKVFGILSRAINVHKLMCEFGEEKRGDAFLIHVFKEKLKKPIFRTYPGVAKEGMFCKKVHFCHGLAPQSFSLARKNNCKHVGIEVRNFFEIVDGAKETLSKESFESVKEEIKDCFKRLPLEIAKITRSELDKSVDKEWFELDKKYPYIENYKKPEHMLEIAMLCLKAYKEKDYMGVAPKELLDLTNELLTNKSCKIPIAKRTECKKLMGEKEVAPMQMMMH